MYDDEEQPTPRRESASSAPGLIIRLTDPPKIFLLAADAEQEECARALARTIRGLFALIERQAAAA